MPPIPQKSQTEDSIDFNPDKYFEAWKKEEIHAPYDNDFRKFIIKTFGLPMRDDYGYMAQSAEVTLQLAQTCVEVGRQGNMHAWYRDAQNHVVRPSEPSADQSSFSSRRSTVETMYRRETIPTPPI